MAQTRVCGAAEELVGRLVRRMEQQWAPDGELLARFADRHDEQAFAQLIRRHGLLVAGVARRIVGDSHLAEDVFQATFLLLARKASGPGWKANIGPWLHGVAYRVACKARRLRCRSATTRGDTLAAVAAASDPPLTRLSWQEVQAALHEELERLPARLRDPLVLCYLQDATRDEAASVLGLTLATLKRRLESGRKLLRAYLTRRGITLGLAGLGIALAPASVRSAAARETARLGCAFMRGGSVPAPVAALLHTAASAVVTRAVVAASVVVLGVVLGGWALVPSAAPASNAMPRSPAPEQPAATVAAPAEPVDYNGDALPAGALLRLGETRFRAGAHVHHLAFSLDGKRLASWGNSLYNHDRLSVWDAATGKELRGELAAEGSLAAFAWCTDGRGYALVNPSPHTDQSNPFIWEFTAAQAKNPAPSRGGAARGIMTGVLVGNVPEYYGPFTFAADGKWLAAYHAGGGIAPEVVLFQVAAGKRLRELKAVRKIPGLDAKTRTLGFTQDRRLLLAFGFEHPDNKTETVAVYDTSTGRRRNAFTIPMALHQGTRKTFALSPDGALLAVGLADGTARLHRLADGRELRSVGSHVTKGKRADWSGVSAVAFSPDSKRLVTAGRDEILKVWEVASGRELFSLRGHHSWPEALAFTRDGKRLASSGQDNLIRLWDMETGKPLVSPKGHSFAVWGLSVSPDGRRALTNGWDGSARLWDLRTGLEIHRFPKDGGAEAVLLDNRTVVTPWKGKWKFWDAVSGHERTPPGDLAQGSGQILGLSPDGATLLSADRKTLTLWAWPSGRRLQQIEAEKDIQRALLTADGATVATFDRDSSVTAWDRKTGMKLGELPVSVHNYKELLAPAGAGLVVTVGAARPPARRNENGIFVCDLRSREIFRSFPRANDPHRHPYPMSLAVSPDERTLVLGESDGTAVLYEMVSGTVRRVLRGHREAVPSLAFAGTTRLITTSMDHSALVWDVSLRGGAPLKPLAANALTDLWGKVAQREAEPAFAALAQLMGDPNAAVSLVRARLKPATGIDDGTLDRIVRGLNDPRFKVRQQAALDLEHFGALAVPGIKKRLAKAGALELKRRLAQFLSKHDRGPTPEEMREVRVVQLLEELATPEALALLGDLARGHPDARRTREAAQALARRPKSR
jgi:RNA polymerase sigma factor (sigma-70 family)